MTTHFSVSCFLQCFLMHLVAQIMESTIDTTLTTLSSTSAKTKVKADIFSYSDDCAPNATTKDNMQTVLTRSQGPVKILP